MSCVCMEKPKYNVFKINKYLLSYSTKIVPRMASLVSIS